MPKSKRRQEQIEAQLVIDGVDVHDTSKYDSFVDDITKNPPEKTTEQIKDKQYQHLRKPCRDAGYAFTEVLGLNLGVKGYMRCEKCGFFAAWVLESGELRSPKQLKQMRKEELKRKKKKP